MRPIENIQGIGSGDDDAARGDGTQLFGLLYFSATRIPRQSKVTDEEKVQQSGSLDGEEEPSNGDGIRGLDGHVRVDLDRYNG